MKTQYLAVLCISFSSYYYIAVGNPTTTNCESLLSALQSNHEVEIVVEGNLFCNETSHEWPSKIEITQNKTLSGDFFGMSSLTFPRDAKIVVNNGSTLQIKKLLLFMSNVEAALGLDFIKIHEKGKVVMEKIVFALDFCLLSGNYASQWMLQLDSSLVSSSKGDRPIRMFQAFYICYDDGLIPDTVIKTFSEEDCTSNCLTRGGLDPCHDHHPTTSLTKSNKRALKKISIIALTVLSFVLIIFVLMTVILLWRARATKTLNCFAKASTEDRNVLLSLPCGASIATEKVQLSDKPEALDARETRGQSIEMPEVQSRTISNWNFRLSDVEINEPLGKGSFGKVYKGHWQGTDVAVKCIIHGKNFLEMRNEPFEAYLSRHVSHPNVVQTFIIHTVPKGGHTTISHDESLDDGSFSDMAPREAYNRNIMMSTDDVFGSMAKGPGANEEESLETWIVLEFCDRGSLSYAIKMNCFKMIQPNGEMQPHVANALLTALDIANAMMYLHNVRIIHGDLKAENVLLKSDVADPRGFVCKVSDFGLSRFLAEDTHIETFTYGTITHMPPELLKGGVLTPAADVYSFAVLMWELLTGIKPFEGKTHGEIVLLVVNREKRPSIPHYCPDGYAELLEDCWRQSYQERPGFPEVVDRLKELLQEIEDDDKSHQPSNGCPSGDSVTYWKHNKFNSLDPIHLSSSDNEIHSEAEGFTNEANDPNHDDDTNDDKEDGLSSQDFDLWSKSA